MSSQSPYGKDLLPSGVYMKAVSFVHTTGKPNLEIDGLEGQVDTVPHVPCTSACIRAFRSDRAASCCGSRWVRDIPLALILSPAWVVTQAGSGFRLPSFVHRRDGVDTANNGPSTFDTTPSHFPLVVGPLYEVVFSDARSNGRDRTRLVATIAAGRPSSCHAQ